MHTTEGVAVEPGLLKVGEVQCWESACTEQGKQEVPILQCETLAKA